MLIAEIQTREKGRERTDTIYYDTFQRVRWWIFNTVENPQFSVLAKCITIMSLCVILLSISSMILQSLPELYGRYNEAFFAIEVFVALYYTVEYSIRLATTRNIIQFVIHPLNIVDLISVVPFYVDLILLLLGVSTGDGSGLFLVFRTVRLARVMRIFKMGRYASGLTLIVNSLKRSYDALLLMSFLLSITVILFSSLIYYFERGTWDENDRTWYRDDGTVSPFQSIPMSSWWCMVTITTVGYGDAVPITIPGKIVAVFAMIVGVIGIAFPITIIGTHFSEEWIVFKTRKREMQKLRRKEKEVLMERDYSDHKSTDLDSEIDSMLDDDPVGDNFDNQPMPRFSNHSKESSSNNLAVIERSEDDRSSIQLLQKVPKIQTQSADEIVHGDVQDNDGESSKACSVIAKEDHKVALPRIGSLHFSEKNLEKNMTKNLLMSNYGTSEKHLRRKSTSSRSSGQFHTVTVFYNNSKANIRIHSHSTVSSLLTECIVIFSIPTRRVVLKDRFHGIWTRDTVVRDMMEELLRMGDTGLIVSRVTLDELV